MTIERARKQISKRGIPSPSAFLKSSPEVLLRRYIIAQTLGAYIACLFVYTGNQWKVLIDASEALMMAAGPAEYAATQFTPNGFPGIFVPYLLPGQTLPRVILIVEMLLSVQ